MPRSYIAAIIADLGRSNSPSMLSSTVNAQDDPPGSSASPGRAEPRSPAEMTKREKRRLREARKKEGQQASRPANETASGSQRSSQRGQSDVTLGAQHELPASVSSSRAKSRKAPQAPSLGIIDESRIAQIADDIRGKTEKLKAKWGESWDGKAGIRHKTLAERRTLKSCPRTASGSTNRDCLPWSR
jgi:hypothetical protein